MSSRADANQEATKGVKPKLEAEVGDVQAQLGDVQSQLGDEQSRLAASNQVLLTALAELKMLLQQLAKVPPQDA